MNDTEQVTREGIEPLVIAAKFRACRHAEPTRNKRNGGPDHPSSSGVDARRAREPAGNNVIRQPNPHRYDTVSLPSARGWIPVHCWI